MSRVQDGGLVQGGGGRDGEWMIGSGRTRLAGGRNVRSREPRGDFHGSGF